MDVSSRVGLSANLSGNNSPVQSSDQQLADQLVHAAEKGDTHQVIRAVAASGLNILSLPHSETGNTALHAAIKHGHVEVVGAITHLLVNPYPHSSSSVSLRTLLAQKNNENKSPLEASDITPEIKTELLAGLSDLWPFCGRHNGYIVIPYQQKACGCRVCELCAQTPQTDYVTCANCPRYLSKEDTFKDTGMLREVKNQIKKYQILFEGEGIPTCPGDCQGKNLAYPPFVSQCGHVLCYNCVSRAGKTCQATIDDSDKKCQQPLKAKRMDEDARKQFMRLFSSKTQYDDDSAIGQFIQETTNRPRTPAVQKIKAMPWTDPFKNLPKAITHVINGIIAETCRCFPHRYAVPKNDRIPKTYYDDDPIKNLKIEELEYWLELNPEKVLERLETALKNARAQQQAEQKAAEQRMKAFYTEDEIDILPLHDEPAQINASDCWQDILPSVSSTMTEAFADNITPTRETVRANASAQQQDTEETTTEQCMTPPLPEDDIEILPPPDEPDQLELAGSAQEIFTPAACEIAESLPQSTAAIPETAQPDAQTRPEAEQTTSEQHVISSPTDDSEILTQPYETDQQEASGSSQGIFPPASCEISETLPDSTATTLETSEPDAQASEEAEQAVAEQHVIASPTDDVEILTQPYETDQREASGSSQGIFPPASCEIAEALPDSTTATPETAQPEAQASEEAEQAEAEQHPTEQHVIAQPTSDDSGKFAPSYALSEMEAFPFSRRTLSFEPRAIPTTLPESVTTTFETAQPYTPTQQAAEQHVIAHPTEDIAIPEPFDESVQQEEASGSSQALLPPELCARPGTLPGVSIASEQGLRPTMEDAHTATLFTITVGGESVPIKLLGVFDGHGTREVADHAAQHIVEILTQWLERYNEKILTDVGIWNAIKIAFVELSRRTHFQYSGSTACVALIINNVLWIANLGDSRAILVNRNGEDIQLSEDAKPQNETYKKSIKNRGGFVKQDEYGCYRVKGILAPARALSDHHLDGAVSARTKITRFDLTGFTGCLALVCDGVTDVFTTKKIGDITREGMNDNDPDVNIADRIVTRSLVAKTTDNVSAVVSLLGGA